MTASYDMPASLEALVETGMLQVENLHPGGSATTLELAELCRIGRGTTVLDVACGTGETACLLARQMGANVTGIDRAGQMIARADAKACEGKPAVRFLEADAAAMPFADDVFDAVICECTLCLLDKTRVLEEMIRVVKPGGHVGMHDLCWKADAPAGLRSTLAELESERPETLAGWERLFADAGLTGITTVDMSNLVPGWMRKADERLGVAGRLALSLRIVRRWGFIGLWRVLRSERVFASPYMGYGIVTARAPERH